MTVEDDAARELASLRSEIVTRVVFQNVLLCLCWCALGAIPAAAWFGGRPEILVLYSVLAVSAVAMWAHHGARTAQIRFYLQSSIETGPHGAGWEHALAAMRFRSLLGSRWVVSTKGFFLGSQVLVGGLLYAWSARPWSWLAAIAGILASMWLLHEPTLDPNGRAQTRESRKGP